MAIVKFILGWIMWLVLLIISLLFSLLTWNWKETVTLDMGNVISEIFGKSTWEAMTGDYDDE